MSSLHRPSCRRKSSRVRHHHGELVVDSISLHEAAWMGDITVLNRLLEVPLLTPRVNDPDVEWGYRTPLHIASQRGKTWCLQQLKNLIVGHLRTFKDIFCLNAGLRENEL